MLSPILIAATLGAVCVLLGVALRGLGQLARSRQGRARLLPTHAASSLMGASQRRELQLPLDFHPAFDACRDSVRLVPGASIRRMSREEGTIEARVGPSWRSLGVVIDFDVIVFDEGGTYVRVVARPWMPGTLIDYGRSLELIEIIYAALERRCRLPSLPGVAQELGAS